MREIFWCKDGFAPAGDFMGTNAILKFPVFPFVNVVVANLLTGILCLFYLAGQEKMICKLILVLLSWVSLVGFATCADCLGYASSLFFLSDIRLNDPPRKFLYLQLA